MARWLWVLLSTALLWATGQARPAAAQPTGSPPIDVSQALVTLADLTELWELDGLPDVFQWAVAAPRAPTSAARTTFCEAEPPTRGGGLATAEAQFERDLGLVWEGVFHAVDLLAPGEAAPAVSFLQTVLATCPGWRETDADGSVVTYRLSPLAFPALGDQSFAVRVDLDLDEGLAAGQLNLVVIRRGDLVSLVGHSLGGTKLGLAPVAPDDFPVPTVLTERLARRADARLAQLGPSPRALPATGDGSCDDADEGTDCQSAE